MSIHDRERWFSSDGPNAPVYPFTGYEQDYLVRPEDLDDWLMRAAELKWVFARSMASTPHSYVVRDKGLKNEEYRKAFGVISTFGQPGKFYERLGIYLSDGNKRWWNMTRHEYESIILNHSVDGKDYGVQDAPSTQTQWFWHPFDGIGCYYDNVHSEVEDYEKVALWKTCDRVLEGRKPKTLDLGSGTGGTLDARITGSRETTVVDMSRGMLNALVHKYPKIFAVVPASAEEFLSWETGSNYDLVISSFGSASHLSPEAIDLLQSRSKRAVVLSFYNYGYRPSYLNLINVEIDDSDSIATALDLARGKSEVQGNYLTITLEGAA